MSSPKKHIVVIANTKKKAVGMWTLNTQDQAEDIANWLKRKHAGRKEIKVFQFWGVPSEVKQKHPDLFTKIRFSTI